MAALRNIAVKLLNGRVVFDTPKAGYTGAEILARTTQGVLDSGPGLLAAFVDDSTAFYAIRVVYSTIVPYDFTLRTDGALSVRGHGLFTYSVYKNNLLKVSDMQ